MPAEADEARVLRWAQAAALLVLVLQCVAFSGVRKDDAFMTYRYAQNLVLGRGMVFNPGDHIMGSMSPGHVLLSALAYLGGAGSAAMIDRRLLELSHQLDRSNQRIDVFLGRLPHAP